MAGGAVPQRALVAWRSPAGPLPRATCSAFFLFPLSFSLSFLLQVDDELEGLGLDDEAEYQRFLQVRWQAAAGAAWPSAAEPGTAAVPGANGVSQGCL